MGEVVFRAMRAEELGAVLDLLEVAFGVRFIFEGYCAHDRAFRPEDFLLALEGDRPVSCVQIFTKRIRLGGEAVSLGGIGSVATAPSHRQRRLASELLRRSVVEMRRRGMAISLLFSGLLPFYERLGWTSVAQAKASFRSRPGPRTQPPTTARIRGFRPADRAAVERLYERYSAGLETSTVRDAAYWEGQLRYAGSPDEAFRVAERDGRLVAYARRVVLHGVPLATEYAREKDAARDLATLLAELAPDGGALVLPFASDEELLRELEARAERLDRFPDRGLMWRVLDRGRIAAIAARLGIRADDERAALEALVGGARALYWPSDRF